MALAVYYLSSKVSLALSYSLYLHKLGKAPQIEDLLGTATFTGMSFETQHFNPAIQCKSTLSVCPCGVIVISYSYHCVGVWHSVTDACTSAQHMYVLLSTVCIF